MQSAGVSTGLVEQIFAALPQTQCTRCGYPDCKSYAEAIAQGDARINQCPPGGTEGIAGLSRITGQVVQALNPTNGVESPRSVAFIDENWCIGCTLCVDVCPTDAIVGSNKRMHTVIEPHCTGCELCLPVCPVDCIVLENVTEQRTGWAAWSQQQADNALKRYEFHSYRGNKNAGQSPKSVQKQIVSAQPSEQTPLSLAAAGCQLATQKRAVIEAALAKARLQRKKPNV